MSNYRRRDFLANVGCTMLASAGLGWRRSCTASEDSPKRSPVKVGQIGVGHAHASGKIETLRSLPEQFEVVGVVEPDSNLRQQWENTPAYRGLRWLNESQLLATPGLQVVTVETAVRDLVPTAMRCIAAGKHVHVDKPAGESLGAFEKLLNEAKERQLCVQMGYMLRHNPAFQFLRKAVGEHWLGEIFEVHGTMSKTVTDAERRQIAEYPGGGMFELGCHLIDAVVSILGKPDHVTPFARQTRALSDNQLAVLEYSKCTATIRVALMEVDGMRRRQFVVCGTKGTIDIRPLEPPNVLLTLASPHGDYQRGRQSVEMPKVSGRYDDQLVELAQVARGELEPSFGYSHDLAVQETVLRASGVAVKQ